MFRSRRSGLVRRLWRSRLVTGSDDGRDGGKRAEEGGPDAETNIQRAVTRGDQDRDRDRDRSLGSVGTARTGCSDREPEHRCAPRGRDSDSGTVTCCVFGEWDPRPRRGPYSALKKDGGGACRCQPELKSSVHSLLKRLRDKHLEALLRAVDTKGGVPGECVMVLPPQSEDGRQVSPPHLLCRLYRWSDLQGSDRLKALSHCQSFRASGEEAQVCCNPYHYSRLCGPESPPPPYSVSHSDEHKSLESTQSYTETVPLRHTNQLHVLPRDYTDTGTSLGSSTAGGRRSHWCSVAYWEQRTRVGRLYPAHEPSLSIFYDLPQGTGLCLGQLHTNAYHRRRDDMDDHSIQAPPRGGGSTSSCVQQVRGKIGYGLTLSREPDGVWVYNRSQHPVFVHSATLDLPSARGLSVKRVMPGFSLKVFDYERSSWIVEHGVKPECHEGPWDPHSVRISFAKGWGPCYSRQFITSCPCWLEVLLNNHR